MSEREFDLVIFGATGTSGQFVVEELAVSVQQFNLSSLKWAVSGRNDAKLRAGLELASQITGLKSLHETPIVVTDINDQESIKQMARRTKLVVNCVGPYNLYGERVVAACVEAGTSHIDLSGEHLYLHQIYVKFNDAARQHKCYVIGTTGWDSIPVETGMQILRQKFNGKLNSVEEYVKIESPHGLRLNIGTYASAVYMMGKYNDRVDTRINVGPTKWSLTKSKTPKRNPVGEGYCIAMSPDIDRAAVSMTQNRLREDLGSSYRPVQFQSYMTFTISRLFHILYMGFFLLTLSRFEWGRRLLVTHPALFTFNMVKKSPPTREECAATRAEMVLRGKGWSADVLSGQSEPESPPNKTITLSIKGGEPSNIVTAICMVQSALAILVDGEQLPRAGGVYSPGYAFQNTKIIERLQARGLEYTVVE